MPASYLQTKLSDGRRPVNHAYAITGHKSEGITVDRVFVRGGSHADQHWMYVVASRVRRRADFYLIEGPAVSERDEAGILDLASPMSADPYDVAVAALGRADPQRMAIDAARETAHPLVSTQSTKELRAERDQLAQVLATRPRAQLTSFRRTVEQRAETEQRLTAARDRQAQLESWLASHGRGVGALARRAELKAARDELTQLGLLERHLTDRASSWPTVSDSSAGTSSSVPCGMKPTPPRSPAIGRSAASWPGGHGRSPRPTRSTLPNG